MPTPPYAATPPGVPTPQAIPASPGVTAQPAIPASPGVPAQPAIPVTPGVTAPPGTPTPPGVPAPPCAPAPQSEAAPPIQQAPPTLPGPPRLPASPPPAVPAELPAAPRHRLVGREAVAGELMAHLARRDPGPGRPVAVVVGPPGAGKTALVLRAAHGVREHFPDGQVFVDLHPADSLPVPPDVLVRRVVRSLGGAPAAEHPEESRAQLRNALSTRRVLVVLDNVDSEAQVRPLLVDDGRSAVLVAARRELSALPERFSRRIGALEEADALGALTDLVGADRTGAERPAALSIVRSCAGLPLAVHIAGLWLTARPHRRLRDLADRLADERDRLAVLRIGDLSVHAGVTAYVRVLPPPLRTALRELARSSEDFGIPEIPARVTPSPWPPADLLEELLHRQLIHPVPAARQDRMRYRLYDAVRLHAAEAARRAPARMP
ncbi:AAA family ATPase [Streptomyces sp. GMY01]|nr:AAA family ATPase [Streptomyces sp. GMY02]